MFGDLDHDGFNAKLEGTERISIKKIPMKEIKRRALYMTEEQWQDLVDVIMYGLMDAMRQWLKEGRVKNLNEAFSRVGFIVDLQQSDWWYEDGGSEKAPSIWEAKV